MLTDLVSESRSRVERYEANLPSFRLDQEVVYFRTNNYFRLTRSLIQNDPAALAGNHCWLDAEFVGLDTKVGNPRAELGFDVRDRDGNLLDICQVPKGDRHQVDAEVLKLRPGDKVRLVGVMVLFPIGMTSAGQMKFEPNDARFQVESIERSPTPSKAP